MLSQWIKGLLVGSLSIVFLIVGLGVAWLTVAKSQVERRLDAKDEVVNQRHRILLKPPAANAKGEDYGVASYDWGFKALGGQEVRFSEFRGRVVFLSFWATWCLPCRKEMPHIEALRDALSDEDFRIVLLSDEDSDVVKSFVGQNDIGLPVYLLREGVPAALWTSTVPTSFLVGCNGKILLRQIGAADWSAPQSVRRFESALEACTRDR